MVAIESRGFIAGGALAHHLNCGMVLARKKGKLPWLVEREEYQLEYGTDCIETTKTPSAPASACLIVDDLLATGGTCGWRQRLVERLGGKVVGCAS